MYPQEMQNDYNNQGLREEDGYPGNPDSEYGWEKLFSERLYFAYARNYGLNVRVARFHNIFGPEGTYQGGREKAPAAMCRKVIENTKEIEVWGTGHQTRSFLFIDDCVDAVRLFMQSDFPGPLNIGSEEMVTINGLAEMAIDISGKVFFTIKNIPGPVGVMGRNSNNDLIRQTLGWEPRFTLREGMVKTFEWIKKQYE
jgi:nucleoside-diphosphate-sugar epimerase